MEDAARHLRTEDFEFEYKSKGSLYRLSVPVEIPYEKDRRELVQRLMTLHSIPPYEEESLYDKISCFIADASLREWDRQADQWLSNSSQVFVHIRIRESLAIICQLSTLFSTLLPLLFSLLPPPYSLFNLLHLSLPPLLPIINFRSLLLAQHHL